MSAQAEVLPADLFGTCPLPKSQDNRVLLGHGSGGQLTADLIRELFVPGFGNEVLAALEDQATLKLNGTTAPRIAFTTDSFVIRPIFFPGGDIGRLAVHGTVNDLAVGGARPLFLSAAFILEEGLAIDDLQRIVASMRRACDEAGVALVTGDTRVVDRGKGDQIFIITSGIGVVPAGVSLSIRSARSGDRVLISGTIGDHGIAIVSVREGIEFETVMESDSAALNDLVRAMLEAAPGIRCMRDPTREGLSSVVNELAETSGPRSKNWKLVTGNSKMPDLCFSVERAEAVPFSASPLLNFKLNVSDAQEPHAPVRGVTLRCQIRIEPARRRYTGREQGQLLDLFGEPHRRAQTTRPMLWTHTGVRVPPFTGQTLVDLPVPCTYDVNVAATKYFHALQDGEVPLCLLFSGTVLYESPDRGLRAAPISWDQEACFRLPVRVWKDMMEMYYPNSAWLCLRRDVFDRLYEYKSHYALPTWEQALERLLACVLGRLPRRVLVVGCEPGPLGEEEDIATGLSPPVESAVDEAVALVESLIDQTMNRKAGVENVSSD
jgi:hydrogenase expression/formation protein HypE